MILISVYHGIQKASLIPLLDTRLAILDHDIMRAMRHHNRQGQQHLQQLRTEKQYFKNLRNVWKFIIVGVETMVNSYQQAFQVTACNVHSLFLERNCPGFDPPSFREIEEYKKKHPFNYPYVLMRDEIRKYLEQGVRGRFALAATFLPFDTYAFRNQYASTRADDECMFMSPTMTMRRLSYEYRMGEYCRGDGTMVRRFRVASVTSEPPGMFDLKIPKDRQVHFHVAEDVANTTLSVPLEGLLPLWKLTLGSQPSTAMDMLINADAREIMNEARCGMVVRQTYVVQMNTSALIAIQAFQQQQDDPDIWTSQVFARIVLGTLYSEDQIHLCNSLVMLNDVGLYNGYGYDWLTRMEWLSDKYSYREQMENLHVLQLVKNRRRDCGAVLVQKWYRSVRGRCRDAATKIQAWTRGQLFVRGCVRRKASASLLVQWFRRARSRVFLLRELDRRANIVHSIRLQLEYYMSDECLQTNQAIQSSIRRQADNVPYVPYQTLLGLPAIMQFLVQLDKFQSLRCIYRAVTKIPWIVPLQRGLAQSHWPEEMRMHRHREQQEMQMYYTEHRLAMDMKYHQDFMRAKLYTSTPNVARYYPYNQ